MHGTFITFEGCDGSGKSTQLKTLYEKLSEAGFDVLLTREPGGTPVGEIIREMLLDPKGPERTSLCETLLYAASRAELVEQVLVPALRRGKVVLTERYIDSTLVYQGIAGGIDVQDIENVNRIATGGLVPDLTLVFDIEDPKVILDRMASKQRDKIESRGEMYHTKVRQGYRVLATKYPDRIKLVDGALPRVQVEGMVFELVCQALRRRKGGKDFETHHIRDSG